MLKWDRLNNLISEHLSFVTCFSSQDFSDRSQWESQKFTFTCLSLKILKNLNRIMEDPAFVHLVKEVLENVISTRRNLVRACNKLLFDVGNFHEVRQIILTFLSCPILLESEIISTSQCNYDLL